MGQETVLGDRWDGREYGIGKELRGEMGNE